MAHELLVFPVTNPRGDHWGLYWRAAIGLPVEASNYILVHKVTRI